MLTPVNDLPVTPTDDRESSEIPRADFIRHELSLPKGNTTALIELEKQTFAIAFEEVLEQMASGETLTNFCREYHLSISPARFRTWIFRDPKRKEAYVTAKAIGAEAVEDDLIRISDGFRADGSASPEETQRSQLRINTRKFLLQVWNRRKYGDVKHIEQTTTTKIDTTTMTKEQLEEQLMRSLGFGDDVFTVDNGGGTSDL